MSPTWLALDIGGANLKAAHASGAIRIVPFPLWKEPERLAGALAQLADGLPPFDRVAATMTGELCDCFPTKRAGVAHIQSAVKTAFAGRSLHVWGTDGRIHSLVYAHLRWELVAAANWLALATVAAHLVPPSAFLIDVGSTTADLIPLDGGEPIPKGRTDTDRLGHGELIYAGVARTPVCALATALPHRGVSTALSAELFATTRDVYLTLGDLPEEADDTSTADGRPATRAFARDRLARMVCADRETFFEEDALALGPRGRRGADRSPRRVGSPRGSRIAWRRAEGGGRLGLGRVPRPRGSPPRSSRRAGRS